MEPSAHQARGEWINPVTGAPGPRYVNHLDLRADTQGDARELAMLYAYYDAGGSAYALSLLASEEGGDKLRDLLSLFIHPSGLLVVQQLIRQAAGMLEVPDAAALCAPGEPPPAIEPSPPEDPTW